MEKTKLITWKNGVKHILIDDGIKQIRIFRKTITIQWHKNQDIRGKTAEECEVKANDRIKQFTDTFTLVKIITPYKQLKRHYGMLGTELAKKKVKEGKKLIIYAADGTIRHRIDTSVPPAELDNEHIRTAKPDTDAWQRFMPKVDEGWDMRLEQITEQLANRNFDMQTTMQQMIELMKQIMERIR